MRVLLIPCLLALAACAGTADGLEYSGAGPHVISTADLQAHLEARDDLVVIDVRTPAEWEQGTIEGALLFATGEAPDRVDELDPTQAYAIICKAGGRSARFAQLLIDQGFDLVLDVGDGMDGWYEAGR